MKLFLKSKRKIQKLLAGSLLAAILAVTFTPTNTVMAAEASSGKIENNSQESTIPNELTTSYFQLASSNIMQRTSYFIPDQEFSFKGTFVSPLFYIPSRCQARLVIAAIGNEPLYINVLDGWNVSQHTITVTPNQSQVHVFNISAGDHRLKFSSITASQFIVRLQMYTWDY